MNRTVNVVRMQLVNRTTFLVVPLLILTAAFVLTLAIYAIVSRSIGASEPMNAGGASGAPLWYFAVLGVQALTMTFPFSQAMSVTRREFYQGTLLAAGLGAFVVAAIYTAGGLIEGATDGWGMQGFFFRIPWVWNHGPLVAGFVFLVAAFLLFVIGFAGATVYRRFGLLVLVGLGLTIGVAIVGALWLIGRLDAWAAVGDWFTTQGSVGLALWGVALAAALAGATYAILRRLVV